jgi:hypothetical protein
MLQAAVCDGCTLDAFTLDEDYLGPSEVDVGRVEIVEALVACLFAASIGLPRSANRDLRR